MVREFLKRVLESFYTTSSGVVNTTVKFFSPSRHQWTTAPTKSWSRADYDFWRKAYYCQAKGLELSGLFIKPLVNKIAAWTMGRPPFWAMESSTSLQALTDWWSKNHFAVLGAFLASLKQGDAFLIVNSDLTVSVIPPNLVDPIVDESDYSTIIGWRITQIYQHPTRLNDRMRVVDEYYAHERVRIVDRGLNQEIRTVYPNLLGRLPIVHIPNQPQDGEIFGHPEAKALLEILQRYGITLEAAVEGNERQGRPTPVIKFDNIQDLKKFWDDYGEVDRRTLPDGSTEESIYIGVDLTQILAISAADFKYAQPGSFTEDTERLLGLMFYLILEHLEIPEFVFGNAVASSKASTETQLPIFETYIIMRQGQIEGWLAQVAQIVLGYLSLIQPGITVEVPTLQWRKLSQNGKLTLETLTWAYAQGLVDRRTALLLAPVEVEDIDGVLTRAIAEKEERDRKAQEAALALKPPAAPAQELLQDLSPEVQEQLSHILKGELHAT